MSDRLISAARFPLPRPIAVLAVLESMAYGLVTRHAYDEGLPVAVPLTLGFFLVFPMAEGCRSVASGEEKVGTLSPVSVTLMLLAGAAFGDVLGMLGVLVLLPFLMLMALIGGIPASVVLTIRRRRIRGKVPLQGRCDPEARMRSIPSVPEPVFPDLILEVSRCH
jgi:hypothetical protein